MTKHKTRNRIGDPLRSLAETMRGECSSEDCPMDEAVAFEWYCRMRVVADHIDAEHERRMQSQRQNYQRLIDG